MGAKKRGLDAAKHAVFGRYFFLSTPSLPCRSHPLHALGAGLDVSRPGATAIRDGLCRKQCRHSVHNAEDQRILGPAKCVALPEWLETPTSSCWTKCWHVSVT